MTTHETPSNSESKAGSIEITPKARGAGAIFYIRDIDKFMFFLRDDKSSIPFPNRIDIIGGHLEPGEEPMEAAMREFAEELDDLDTGAPFQPSGLTLFRSWIDERNVEQTIYGCQLDTTPNLRLNEGQRLVFLGRDELATTDFAFNYNEVVQAYAQTV
ncbi:MAG: NUDIX domain-containing protein [Candidatus Saccharimonadales bacterium]